MEPIDIAKLDARARELLGTLTVVRHYAPGRDGPIESGPLVPDSVLRATCYELAQHVVTLVQLIKRLEGRE